MFMKKNKYVSRLVGDFAQYLSGQRCLQLELRRCFASVAPIALWMHGNECGCSYRPRIESEKASAPLLDGSVILSFFLLSFDLIQAQKSAI
jgi:hypothetical protein